MMRDHPRSRATQMLALGMYIGLPVARGATDKARLVSVPLEAGQLIQSA